MGRNAPTKNHRARIHYKEVIGGQCRHEKLEVAQGDDRGACRQRSEDDVTC